MSNKKPLLSINILWFLTSFSRLEAIGIHLKKNRVACINLLCLILVSLLKFDFEVEKKLKFK